jgi:hypothetical protein
MTLLSSSSTLSARWQASFARPPSLLKIVHASPDSIFIIRPLHDFSCLLGFLIELLKAAFQIHRYRGGGLTDLCGMINGLFFMIEAPLNFAGLHHDRTPFQTCCAE